MRENFVVARELRDLAEELQYLADNAYGEESAGLECGFRLAAILLITRAEDLERK